MAALRGGREAADRKQSTGLRRGELESRGITEEREEVGESALSIYSGKLKTVKIEGMYRPVSPGSIVRGKQMAY